MKTNGCIAILAAAFVLFFAISCGTDRGGDSMAVEKEQQEELITTVRTSSICRGTLHSYLKTNGTVESRNSISVYPTIAGKIAGTRVDLGFFVTKGQILAYVDPSVPGATYSLSPVTAPIDGSIVSVPLLAGSSVTTQTVVVTIGDLKKLQVKAFIPERYIGQLKLGLSAEILLEAYPSVIFKAVIRRISPVVDEVSRTKEIFLEFSVPDPRINAGMFAKVKVYLREYKNVIAVPETALIIRDGKTLAYTMNTENKAVEHQVVTGISVDGYTQIVSGLQDGDTLIVEGQALLQDGTHVLAASRIPEEKIK